MSTPTIEQIAPNAARTSGKKIQATSLVPVATGGLEERDTEDHRADDLGGGRLEQVGTAAGAVADVVADEVGDHGRVARIVFGNSGFDLADEIGANIGGLGVDAAAELGEEGDEAGTEGEADDPEWRFGDRRAVHPQRRCRRSSRRR